MTTEQIEGFREAVRFHVNSKCIDAELNTPDYRIADIMVGVLKAISRKSKDVERDYKENREAAEQGTRDCFQPLVQAYTIAACAANWELAEKSFYQGATVIMSLVTAIANLEAIEDTMKAFSTMSTHDAVKELERRKEDLTNVLAFYGGITELWNEENS